MARLAIPNKVSISWQSFIWYVADVGPRAIILIEAGTVYRSIYLPATGASTVFWLTYNTPVGALLVERGGTYLHLGDMNRDPVL